MNKYLRAILVLFVFIFAYEWLVHGVLLAPFYNETAMLWRPEAEMQSKIHWMFIGQLLTAVIACMLFSRSDSSQLADYFIFGALLGLLFCAAQLVMYTVAPYPILLVAYWCVAELVKYTLAGVLFYFVGR